MSAVVAVTVRTDEPGAHAPVGSVAVIVTGAEGWPVIVAISTAVPMLSVVAWSCTLGSDADQATVAVWPLSTTNGIW